LTYFTQLYGFIFVISKGLFESKLLKFQSWRSENVIWKIDRTSDFKQLFKRGSIGVREKHSPILLKKKLSRNV